MFKKIMKRDFPVVQEENEGYKSIIRISGLLAGLSRNTGNEIIVKRV